MSYTHGVTAAELRIEPASVELADPFARRQLLVQLNGQDVTRQATYVIENPAVATIDASGYLVPVGNGETRVTVRCQEVTATVPVIVSKLDVLRSVDFATEVEPLLSRFGCNAGGCHGKASGQNGFKLSLFGFDTNFDYQAITQDARGRRVFRAAPEQSLLLQKAVGSVPHGGGKRITVGSEPYRILLAWLQAGAPASAPDVPQVARLKIIPPERTLVPGEQQQLVVLAEYTDGSQRDVTRAAEFSSNLDVVAKVSEDGLVTANPLTGEATIMARYRGQVTVFRALRPQGTALAQLKEFQPFNTVDELAAAKWMKLGLQPSPLVDDATFLRRVTLDLAGRLPTVEESRVFLAEASADKRIKLADRLLASPDYPAYFALKWGSILRNSSLAGADQASYAFHNWIKEMVAQNRPYDEFVRGIVAASGEWQDAPAINWYWQSRDDQLHQVTADTAQIFLGLRLQCAKCHHHPYERWGQDDYYGLAGFFTRLGRKSFGQPPPYFSASQSTVNEKHPITGKPLEPKYLDGAVAKFSPQEDPRHALVDWMAKPENPFFAKALVNRLWGHFFGRGLVQEVDDLRETNPPSNPELLDHLAREFVEQKYNVKHIIRLLVTSRAYQLSSEPTVENKADLQNFARFYARRLPAEVALDAVDQACGSKSTFNNMSKEARAVDLPNERFGSYFLDAFDRPKRVSACECERSTSATLAQVLLLSNSDELEGKLNNDQSRIARLVKEKAEPAAIVEELYLAAFSRFPSEKERQAAVELIDRDGTSRRQACEDVLWSLLNSREFLFNH